MTNCKVVLSRGSIYLIGEQVNFVGMKWRSLLKDTVPAAQFDNRIKRDGEDFHLTLLDKRSLSAMCLEAGGKSKETFLEDLKVSLEGIDLGSFVDVGAGRATDEEANTAYFVLVSFEKLRLVLNIEVPVSFHITLAFNPGDVHSVSKDLKCLLVNPLNDNLLPTKTVVEEVKSLIRSGHHEEALRVLECVKESQRNVELEEIRAMVLFKLSRYQECLDLTDELLEKGQVDGKLSVLLNVRMADAAVALKRFRKALLPIWRALKVLDEDASLQELKDKASGHLIDNLLLKCARHGYLRIDCVPVSRKLFHESESKSLTIEDEFALKLFSLFKSMKSQRNYESILDRVTCKYGLICHEDFDEHFMPLESRWIICRRDNEQQSHVLQRNFSYVWPNLIAVSSTPRHAVDISAMAGLGITLVVTLTEEEPLKADWFGEKIRNLFIPVPNYNPPSVSAADRIVWEVACELHRGGKSLIHCGGGKGRAGTATAVVIMTLGMDPTNVWMCDGCLHAFRPFGTCSHEDCRFSKIPLYEPATCLNIIRTLRPESLETIQQEAFLKTYSSALWQRSTVPSMKDSFLKEELEEDTLEIFGALPSKLPKVLVLSGLPGSGKTTFAKGLVEKLELLNVSVSHVNQDAIGGREEFESALGSVFKTLSRATNSLLIVDRCNARRSDRSRVLELLHNPEKEHVMFVHFDLEEALCLQRIEQRFEHLTLKPENGRRAVKHFKELLQVPDQIHENSAATLLVIKSIADSLKAISLIESCVPAMKTSAVKSVAPDTGKAVKMEKFYKFPRTEHLFNLGGATRDDLVLSPDAFKAFFAPASGKVITMEEKIDGANVGFSLDAEGSGKILCQNRSHYVDNKYHFQFQNLGSFIHQKRESLERILKDGWILYGEWMFAKHSIHYTALPDVFIAFDLFNPVQGKFLDRASFYAIMSTTNIKFVQPLTVLTDSTPASLEKLLKTTKSAYSDSLIEGIYFRWDQDGALRTRAKLVRSDFISGDEHWSKGKFVLNSVVSIAEI